MATKMTPLRKTAKGRECQLRIPGICNGDPATTVLCHLNGSGTALKSHDIHGAWGCSACHSWVDGGYVTAVNRQTRDLFHLEGVIRTQQKLFEIGYEFELAGGL